MVSQGATKYQTLTFSYLCFYEKYFSNFNDMKTKKATIAAAILIFINIAPGKALPWNEEGTSQLGHVSTAHSTGDVHSTIHYDLTKLLAIKAGLTAEMAETLARYCALVDQINPKSNYPYSGVLNDISIPDTFSVWNESLAGTERGSWKQNSYKEYPPQYWHFPYRDPDDSISGTMTFGIDYPLPADLKYREPPYFWRIPLLNNYNLSSIRDWALYSAGNPGQPDNSTPCLVYYWEMNAIPHKYKEVQPGSIQALGIYLHSLADSYSHEHCMVTDTLRNHPTWSNACGLTYHSYYEFAYDTAIAAMEHATPCIQALWRAIMAYKAENNITTPALWTVDNNGFQDGDGIPDELENDYNAFTDETFLEKWISPTDIDFNEDGIINHYDHTSWRIFLCNNELNPMYKILELKVFLEGFYAGNGLMNQSRNDTANHFPGKVADKIIVELHNPAYYSTIVFSDTIYLFTDGKADLFVPVSNGDSYFITVRHRNSIQVVSANPVSFTGSFVDCNFASSAGATLGSNCKLLSPGLYGLFAGDSNADGAINQADMYNIKNAALVFSKGYLASDINGDGMVDANDLHLADNNAASFIAAATP